MENKINILIVDDEQIVLDSLKKHLRHQQEFSIFTSLSAEYALEILQSTDIHIILTDLMMPEIDGLELLNRAKILNNDIIVIMITGYATINSALQAMQLGAFDYLAKPFTREEIHKVVGRAAELAKVTISKVSTFSSEKEQDKDKVIGGIKGFGQYSWMVHDEDGTVLIGVERPFLINTGRIQTVYLPSKNDELRQGSVFFQVFSTDLRSQSVLSPLSGIVIDINELILKDPNSILIDPYGAGWLIRLAPSNFEEEMKLMGLL
jgi:CheY-like chemotaxis protein/glycine cleavage system H lipoate-binding protein